MTDSITNQSVALDLGEVDARFGSIGEWIASQGLSNGDLMAVLHRTQAEFGYLDRGALGFVARALRLPLSRVYGVASFYHNFRLTPHGRHEIIVCTGTACHIAGATRLLEEAHCRAVGLKSVTVGSTRCLGPCGAAPVVVADGELLGGQTAESVSEIVARARHES
ncbi:MAG: NAD(P)H-dependent oxidoreductase subunit E [Gemmataceae bacterium]|nr:NAD(P)H-dependent oxidoreductase subunit E [Gemmataceae bacterium]